MMRLTLGAYDGRELALHGPDGELIEGQAEVRVESTPGEIPKVVVTLWGHGLDWDIPENLSHRFAPLSGTRAEVLG